MADGCHRGPASRFNGGLGLARIVGGYLSSGSLGSMPAGRAFLGGVERVSVFGRDVDGLVVAESRSEGDRSETVLTVRDVAGRRCVRRWPRARAGGWCRPPPMTGAAMR